MVFLVQTKPQCALHWYKCKKFLNNNCWLTTELEDPNFIVIQSSLWHSKAKVQQNITELLIFYKTWNTITSTPRCQKNATATLQNTLIQPKTIILQNYNYRKKEYIKCLKYLHNQTVLTCNDIAIWVTMINILRYQIT